jgi:hypothetical protein
MSEDFKFGCVVVILCAVLLLGVGGCSAGCSYIGNKIDYSDGYRDGIIDKLSIKGLVFKTTEGQMILDGFGSDGGTISNRIFLFSVKDDAVKKKLEAIPNGQRVRLHYHQVYSSWSPNGDTAYYATDVEVLKK